jgi:hypothetical protein
MQLQHRAGSACLPGRTAEIRPRLLHFPARGAYLGCQPSSCTAGTQWCVLRSFFYAFDVAACWLTDAIAGFRAWGVERNRGLDSLQLSHGHSQHRRSSQLRMEPPSQSSSCLWQLPWLVLHLRPTWVSIQMVCGPHSHSLSEKGPNRVVDCLGPSDSCRGESNPFSGATPVACSF